MEKCKFKIKDVVTFKSKKECKGYTFGGNCCKGLQGIVSSAPKYDSKNKNFSFYVNIEQFGSYLMLETEFYEYNTLRNYEIY